MKWIKKGRIFKPDGRYDWMQEYAQVPVPLVYDDRLRIFYTTRPLQKNGQSVSEVSYIDVARNDPSKILYVHDKPVLPLGGIGTFDEFGIHPCMMLREENEIRFYYQGWTRMYSVPYTTSLGLAVSKDGGNTFQKIGAGPLLCRAADHPFLDNGFFILKENGTYHMVYATCREWIDVNGRLEPVYYLVQATSQDGLNWQRDSRALVPSRCPNEASGRPTMIKHNGRYHMWFCFRNAEDFRGNVSGAYRIGYAFSEDLDHWTRDDAAAGIDLSPGEWDSEMQAYPYVLELDGKIYLFYCGNGFGKEGFGYAELEI